MEVALEDLTVESTGISKVRTLLTDVQVRRLHGGWLAELMKPRPSYITLRRSLRMAGLEIPFVTSKVVQS